MEEYGKKYRGFRFIIGLFITIAVVFVVAFVVGGVTDAFLSDATIYFQLFLLNLMALIAIYQLFTLFVTPPSELADDAGNEDGSG